MRIVVTNRVRVSEPTVKRIEPSEPALRRIDPQTVAEALGGEPLNEGVKDRPGPITYSALRTELMRRL
jgi:hypothetical protein